MAPEANFVFLFLGCSPCYEDGGVALGVISVFPFYCGDADLGLESSSLTLLWHCWETDRVGPPLHLFLSALASAY